MYERLMPYMQDLRRPERYTLVFLTAAAFTTGFLLSYGATSFITKATKAKPVLSWPPEFPNLCRSLDFMPALRNWTVDKWMSIVDEQSRWQKLNETFNFVWKPYFEDLRPFSFYASGNKYFAEFQRPSSYCHVISLGIGYSVATERQLLAKFGRCSLLGVDPEQQGNDNLIEGLNGEFVKAAVGDSSGTYEAVIKIKDSEQKYENVDHTGLFEFLDKYRHRQLIDMIIVDTSGAEWRILHALTDYGTGFPAICQLQIRLNYPQNDFVGTFDAAFATLSGFLKESRFLLLNVEISEDRKHQDLYLVNVFDDQCVERFICPEE